MHQQDNHNVTEFHKLENQINKLLKQGTQQLFVQAIEAEVQSLLNNFTSRQANGK
ncbi:hypothetical protein [Candidatus Enterovibrio escicola]|uniref:Mobile element protein n=1 Tax=Candidatus Enterovibrio escicola TaxID=1927127 RepID=A0A2A5T168_9GAMM|nr:hypothetical protein [Candidatus Enterovibrio escacola]PCS21870.1 hypothetical protein BTN49_2556 [Candidatus Enterovibrio escacola]